jgi:anti-anti-sigma regulatory factor
VFSIFSKKDKAEQNKPADAPSATRQASAQPAFRPQAPAQAPTRPAAGIPNVPIEVALAALTQQRQATMDKINSIESEMNLTNASPRIIAKPIGLPSERIELSALPVVQGFDGRTPQMQMAPLTMPANTMVAGLPSLEHGTSMLLGDTAGALSMDVIGSGVPPALEEAAILFSNGMGADAQTLLVSLLNDEAQLGPALQQAWLMLFDIYIAVAKQPEFDALALDFSARFEVSPPGWPAHKKSADDAALNNSNNAVVIFPAKLDASIVKQNDAIQKAVAKGRSVLIDLSSTRDADADGAKQLLNTLAAFKKAKKTLIITPGSRMAQLAKPHVEAGRKDADDTFWQLLLEGYRLSNDQRTFDDVSIDYCVTYEVSPPAWEPMPAWIQAEGGNSTVLNSNQGPGTDRIDGAFTLSGEVTGMMEAEAQALRRYGEATRQMVIDCSQLSRIDFNAAGQLLNQLMGFRSIGRTIVVREPSYPVAVLLAVVGVNEVAEIKMRRS